ILSPPSCVSQAKNVSQGTNSGRQMNIAIIGGGPAGLMAAEAASTAGAQVDLYDAMASVGRKFLLAGKGGLNLTHSEPSEKFLSRYGGRACADCATPRGVRA